MIWTLAIVGAQASLAKRERVPAALANAEVQAACETSQTCTPATCAPGQGSTVGIRSLGSGIPTDCAMMGAG